MQYPIAIYYRDGQYQVVVPDIDTLTTTGDTIAEAVSNARMILLNHLHQLIMQDLPIPCPSPVGQHLDNPLYAGLTWAIVNIDITRLTGATKQLTVQLPVHLHEQLHHAFQDMPLDKVVTNALKYYLANALHADEAQSLHQ